MTRIRYSHREEGQYVAMKAEATIDGKKFAIERLLHPLELQQTRTCCFWFFRQEAKMLRAWIRQRINRAG